MAKSSVEVEIKGTDKTGPARKNVERGFKGMAGNVSSSLTAIVGKFALLTGALVGGVALVRRMSNAFGEMVDRGKEVESTRRTFETLADSIDESAVVMLDKLRDASSGMVADFDLMQSSNRLVSMSLAETADEAAHLTRMAVTLGAAMGKDAGGAMEEFALLLANQSIPRLDTFGISASNVRARIEQLQKANENMTREQAFSAAVMEEGEIAMRRVGDTAVGLAFSLGRLRASWQNIRDSIAAAAAPLFDDLAYGLSQALTKLKPIIETFAVGFFEILRNMAKVGAGIIRGMAKEMGIDFDRLAQNGETWGRNIVISLANGMATAISAVLDVINSIGQLLTEWLAPGSPPKILPKIDEWGRDTIRAYLSGMEQVTESEARQALNGINYYFDQLLNPINQRLTGIRNERQQILDERAIGLLQRRLQAGFANPTLRRLAELQLEELQLGIRQRGLQAKRTEAVTKAQNKLATAIKNEVDTLTKAKKAKEEASKASLDLAKNIGRVSENIGSLNFKMAELAGDIAEIFDPVIEKGNEVGTTWGRVLKLLNGKLDVFRGKTTLSAEAVTMLGSIADLVARFGMMIFMLAVDNVTEQIEMMTDAVDWLADKLGIDLDQAMEKIAKAMSEGGTFYDPVKASFEFLFSPWKFWIETITKSYEALKRAVDKAKKALESFWAMRASPPPAPGVDSPLNVETPPPGSGNVGNFGGPSQPAPPPATKTYHDSGLWRAQGASVTINTQTVDASSLAADLTLLGAMA